MAKKASKKANRDLPAIAPVTTPLYRFFQFDRAKVNEADRTVPVCFSSEAMVDRGEYDEILDHSPEGADLSRIKDSGPVLVNHNMDDQVGVVESAELSTEDKKGRALIRFGPSARATEIFNDVKSGIRKFLSVGYDRKKVMSQTRGEGGRNVVRFAWTPFEISVVPAGADINAAVGRDKVNRTYAIDDCAWKCRTALDACTTAIGTIEECGQVADASHASAIAACRSAIADLAITTSNINMWANSTAVECVEICGACAAVCDQTIATLRAIGGCANCGICANQAIVELQEAAESCRENAGIEPPSEPTAEDDSQVRSVDNPILTNGAQLQNNDNMRILLDPAPASGGGAPAPAAPAAPAAAPPAPTVNVTEIQTRAAEAEKKRAKKIRSSADALAINFPDKVAHFRGLADKAIDDGKSSEDFNAELLAAVPGIRQARVTTAEDLNMDEEDVTAYSFRRAVESCLTRNNPIPDGREGEVHQEMAKRMKESGLSAEGFLVPHFLRTKSRGMARRDLNVTTFGQGGAFVPTLLQPTVIELLRNRMVTQRLGVQTMAGLSGNVAIPRQTGAATAYSLAESATLTKSTQAIDQIALAPHRVGAEGHYSKQLILQSSVDVENFMRDDLMKVLALKHDKLLLEGSGAGSEPTGVLNISGIGSVHFGAAATYAKAVAFETALSVANADMGKMAFVIDAATRGALSVAPKVANSTFPIFVYEDANWGDGSNDGKIKGYRAATTNQISNHLVFFANWEDLIHAIWGGLDIVVDIYSRSSDAVVKIVVNSWMDIAARHAASFAVSDDSGAQ